MKRKFLWLTGLIMLLGGCTFVQVQNVTELNVRVAVRVPDSSSTYTLMVSPVGIGEVFSSHGGPYSVTILPDEEYIQLLESIQNQITEKLFTEGATLSAEEVATLTRRINDIDAFLEEAKSVNASCRGRVPDFETAVVTVSIEPATNSWVLECS